ncbi:uncharacterized protein LOC136082297 isoform X2 [Hydra vulgaris]|uniref:Uncharacterized protein LOC136082297 isoform X2 n=1 Tax=Hydra vulgaris TaxID=6087 RepID=A0ABM4C6C9_HYDVU
MFWSSHFQSHEVKSIKCYDSVLEHFEVKNMPNMKIKLVNHDENVSAYCSPTDLFTQSSSTNNCPGIYDWNTRKEFAYGHALSLYEKDLNSNISTGDPVADALAIVTYQSCSILSLADGVSWGKKSKLSSNSAVYGATVYLCKNIDKCFTTKDVFKHIWEAFKKAQNEIVGKEATLTTLCVGVVVQLQEKKDRWALCVINVGDSYAYFYNKKTGVKEVTCGSHPIGKERDMRFSGGSLGPADGFNPDLGNLTCSFVIIEKDDIVFLCSDGISDNYDPAIAMFNPKTDISNPNETKNTSKSNDDKKLINPNLDKNMPDSNNCFTNNNYFVSSSEPYYCNENDEIQHLVEEDVKLVLLNTIEYNDQKHLIKIDNEPQDVSNKDIFKQNQTDFDPHCKKSSKKSLEKNEESLLENKNSNEIPLRTFSVSKGPEIGEKSTGTKLTPSSGSSENKHPEKMNETEYNNGLEKNEIKDKSKSETDISSSVDTIHLTPHERQDAILNRMTKVINEITSKNSDEGEVVTADNVCGSIINFVVKRTAEKRRVLEKLQMKKKNSPNEKKNKDNIKKILEDVPGKLDHASIVAYQVGIHKQEILIAEKPPIRRASIQFDSNQKIKGDESRRKSLGDVLG